VVGCKLDLVSDGSIARAVSREEVMGMADRQGIDPLHCFETSAKSSVESVEAVFERVAASCIERPDDGSEDAAPVRVAVPRQKGECCLTG